MPPTLSTVRDQVELHLMDSTNLVYSTTTLDEGIRMALGELSRVYGITVTLSGLDTATTTNFDACDLYVLLIGAVAYALTFRVVGRFEQATPEPDRTAELDALAQQKMGRFRSLLARTELRRLQESASPPHSVWDWEEGTGY